MPDISIQLLNQNHFAYRKSANYKNNLIPGGSGGLGGPTEHQYCCPHKNITIWPRTFRKEKPWMMHEEHLLSVRDPLNVLLQLI